MIPKIDRRRKTRLLVESAILKARMPSNEADSFSTDDILAVIHLTEMMVYRFKSQKKQNNVAELLHISKKLNALSLRAVA